MRSIVPALVAAASLAVAGCAMAGKRAAAGMEESVRQSQAAAGEGSSAAQVAGGRAVRGAAEELASPQTAADIGVAVDAAVTRGLSRVHRELDEGQGRFARDLDATAERASAAALRGAHGELDRMLGEALGECNGLDRRACLKREVHALGQEASAGFIEGILVSRAWIIALIFFLAGAVAALLGRAAWDHFGGRARHIGRNARA